MRLHFLQDLVLGEDMTMILPFVFAKKIHYVPKAFYHYVKTQIWRSFFDILKGPAGLPLSGPHGAFHSGIHRGADASRRSEILRARRPLTAPRRRWGSPQRPGSRCSAGHQPPYLNMSFTSTQPVPATTAMGMVLGEWRRRRRPRLR